MTVQSSEPESRKLPSRQSAVTASACPESVASSAYVCHDQTLITASLPAVRMVSLCGLARSARISCGACAAKTVSICGIECLRFVMSQTATCPSKPAESKSSERPRTHASRHVTVLVCSRRLIVEPESGFHSRIEPSSLPEIRKPLVLETRRQLISE